MTRVEDREVMGEKRQRRALLRAPIAGACVAAFALCVGTAANAQSLPTGCHDANMVRTTLQNEGQFVLVSAVRPIPENPKRIFTSNASGSFGYSIEQGTGEVTGQLCVTARYTDIRVNANIEGATPRWALIGQNTAHNQWIENTRRENGERILLGARVLRSENGQDVRGGFMMVTRGTAPGAATLKNGGAITVSFDNGEIRPTVALGDLETHPTNYSLFVNRPVQSTSSGADPKK
jgi:hypothetical protein